MLYNVVFASAVPRSESAVCVCTSPPTRPSQPPLKVIREHGVELPVLSSNFPLAIHFTPHGRQCLYLPDSCKHLQDGLLTLVPFYSFSMGCMTFNCPSGHITAFLKPLSDYPLQLREQAGFSRQPANPPWPPVSTLEL